MDPGLAGQSSPEPKNPDPIEPASIDLFDPVTPGLIDLSDHAQEPNHEGDTSCSSSTTSDTSDGDDFFQLNPLGLGPPVACSPIEPVHSQRISAQSNFNDDDGISLSAKYAYALRTQSEDLNPAQPGGFRPNQSPPLPPTFRANDIPDPNRIPSSVFTRTKSTSPMEWSVASNESLFSIHMGNSSFSRDHSFLMGNFSGNPLDSYPTPPISPITPPIPQPTPPMSPLPPPIPPVLSARPPIPPVTSSPTRLDIEHGLNQPGAAAATNAEAMKDVLRATAEKHDMDKGNSGLDAIHYAKSVSRQSDGSNTSFRSFAFPILTGDGRSGSVKVEPEHQRMQSQQAEQQSLKIAENTQTTAPSPDPSPAQTPAAERGWFSCFSCCMFCCS